MMEAVVIAFTMGGIFGAIVAVHLKSGKQWVGKEAVVYSKNDQPKIRRR